MPLVVYWPGIVSAGAVNNYLIDFTDFLPTLANVANIPEPSDFGPLDGVSFAARLTGGAGTPRAWTFDHFDPHTLIQVNFHAASKPQYINYMIPLLPTHHAVFII